MIRIRGPDEARRIEDPDRRQLVGRRFTSERRSDGPEPGSALRSCPAGAAHEGVLAQPRIRDEPAWLRVPA